MAQARYKVLVVDDSAVVRRVLTEVIESDDQLEVVGTAANGRIALERITQLRPDLVTLDIEMPVLDGLETLRELGSRGLWLPVVVISTLTERGGRATLQALSLGAADYLTKPEAAGGLAEAKEAIRAQLLPKLRALSGHRRRPAALAAARPGLAAGATLRRSLAPRAAPDATPRLPTRRPPAGRIEGVVLGISTGGPNALQQLLANLHLDVPLLIVQHMPPMFTRLLAERLDGSSPLEVREAEDGLEVLPGRAIVAPGDHHLVLERRGAGTVVRTHQGPLEHSCRPAVDVTLRSALEVWGGNCLVLVMTGMGQDGAAGAQGLHAAGARIFVQDEASSVVWGMPGAVVKLGLADRVLPLERLADELMGVVALANGTGQQRSA